MPGSQIVLSLAELAAISSACVNDSYFVTDVGREGEFRYDPLSSEDPDGAIVIDPSGISGRFIRILEDYVSVSWFGAAPGQSSSANRIAMQNAIDSVLSHAHFPRTVFIPTGRYTIDFPLICQTSVYNSDPLIQAWQYRTITITLRGEKSQTQIFKPSTTIVADFNDKPAIIFQFAKGGGIESLSIEGKFNAPFQNDLFNFYRCDWENYQDGICLDSRFKVHCGVAVDPFPFVATSDPERIFPGLSQFYTRNDPWAFSSGSSGMTFEDMWVGMFPVCFVNSLNGQSQNCESFKYSDIQVAYCRTAFAVTQSQEKANIYFRIVAWTFVHTVFTNRHYGAGIGGNVIIDNVNVAGNVNRFLYVISGGYNPWVIKDIFSESLGTIGVLTATYVEHSISGSEFNFFENQQRDPEFPDTDPDFQPEFHAHLEGVSLNNVTLRRTPGNFNPLEIIGTMNVFNNCWFACEPVIPDSSGSGQQVMQFVNCRTTAGLLGQRGDISAAPENWKNFSVYGDFKLSDYSSEPWVEYGIRYSNEKQKMARPLYFKAIVTKVGLAKGTFEVPPGFPTSGFPIGQMLLYTNVQGNENLKILGVVESVIGNVVKITGVKKSTPTAPLFNTPLFILPYKQRLIVPPFRGTVSATTNEITDCVFSWDIPTKGMFYELKTYNFHGVTEAASIPMNGFVILDIQGTTLTISCKVPGGNQYLFYNGHGVNELNILNDVISETFYAGSSKSKYVLEGSTLRTARQTWYGQNTWTVRNTGILDKSLSPPQRATIIYHRIQPAPTIKIPTPEPRSIFFVCSTDFVMVDATDGDIELRFPGHSDHWTLLFHELRTVTVIRIDNSVNEVTFVVDATSGPGETVNGATSYVMQNKRVEFYFDSTTNVRVLSDV